MFVLYIGLHDFTYFYVFLRIFTYFYVFLRMFTCVVDHDFFDFFCHRLIFFDFFRLILFSSEPTIELIQLCVNLHACVLV